MRGYTSKSLEMLNSEEGQLNAVFACFGSVFQNAQYFEDALSDFLLAYNRLQNNSLTLDDLNALETTLRQRTMGQLLTDIRRHVEFDDDRESEAISDSLCQALVKRNFLAHRYFLEREDQFGTEQGRFGMLKELVEIDVLMQKTTISINAMRIAMCRTLEDS